MNAKPLLLAIALTLSGVGAGAAHAHVRWSIGIGVPFPYAYPYAYPYSYPYPYYGGPWGPGWYSAPPTVIVQPPPVMVTPAPPGPAPQAFWYYCNDPAGYYPQVPSCPAGWTAVPARAQPTP